MVRFLLLLIMLLGVQMTQCAMADATVYEVSKGKHKLYLAGTIHLLREQDFPLPAEFDAAYKSSQKVYFEVDQQQLAVPEFANRFAQAMLLPNNQTIKDVLSPEVWASLQEYANTQQFPLSQTQMFNAAMIGMTISISEFKKLGAGDGVDKFFEQKSRTDKKFAGGLEGPDDVIGYMVAMGKEDPNRMIKSTLEDVNESSQIIIELIDEWRRGDLAALDKEMSQKMRDELPLSYQALVVERNKKWQPKIEAMLKTPEIEMILVGALHLSGSDGLLAQLKKSGYKVEPVKLSGYPINET